MKKHIFKNATHLLQLCLLVVVPFVIAGCSEEDMPFVKLMEERIEFGSGIEKQTVEVRSNTSWTATSDQVWCKVLHGKGSFQGSFEVVTDANTTTSERTANIILTGGGQTTTLLLRQAPVKVSLTLSTNDVIFMNDSDTYKIIVISNDEWKVSSSSAWCSVSPSSGSQTDNFTISVEKNSTERERTADIMVVSQASGAVISQKVNVTQGAGKYYLEVPITEYTLSKGTATLDVKYLLVGTGVTVETNCNVDWIKVGKAENGILKLTVAENKSGIQREGTISLNTAGVEGKPIIKTFRVLQSATQNVLDVLVSDVSVSPMGETVRIPIVTNTTLSVRCSSTWCSVVVNGNDIVVSAQLNFTGASREAIVTVSATSQSGEQLSKTFKVEQAALDSKFEFQSSELVLRYEGETRQVLLTATGDWKLATTSLPQWLTVTPAQGSGSSAVTFVAIKNQFIKDRSVDLAFTNLLSDETAIITIWQEKNPSSAIGDYKYLGMGYDVNGEYASDMYVRASVLDWNKLNESGYIADIISPNSTDERYIYGKTLEVYQSKLATTAGVSASAMGFSASVETSFSKDKLSSEENEFATFRHITKKQSIKLHANLTSIELKSAMSDEAKRDINGGSGTELPTKELIQKYGTHIITGFVLGGSLDYSMTADTYGMSSTVDWSVAVSAGFKFASVGASVSAGYKSFESVQTESSNFETKLTARGGESQYASGKGDQTTYNAWLNSLSDPTKWVMVDYDGSKLIPIWEFADIPTRRNAIEKAVEDYLAAGLDINQQSTHRIMRVRPITLGYMQGDEDNDEKAEIEWTLTVTVDGKATRFQKEYQDNVPHKNTSLVYVNPDQTVSADLSRLKAHTLDINITGCERDTKTGNDEFSGNMSLNYDPKTNKWTSNGLEITKEFTLMCNESSGESAKFIFAFEWKDK